MRIIIVGGGVVGSSLAEYLLRDGHHVVMVEQDSRLCEQLGEKHDMQILQGSGSSPRILWDAGIEETELIIAVTPNNELNILVCGIASQHNVPQRIARLRGREYRKDNPHFDIEKAGVTDVIHPEKVMVDHILQYIETPHAVESANFEDGRVLLRGYRVRDNMVLAGKTTSEVRAEIAPAVVLFAAIARKGKGIIPDGKTRFEAGDIVYALFPRESIETFLKLVGIEKKKNRKVIVSGDSYALMELSRALKDTSNKVVVVDPHLEQAQKIAGMFDGIEVIHGDCTDNDLLRELNVHAASFFVSVSGETDYNMLSALLAKAEGAHEVIVTSPESRHDRLFKSIGLDHVINPRKTAAREILEFVSRGHIGAVVELKDIDIEAIRFNVKPESEIAGLKIKSVGRKLQKGSIVGMIIREDSVILPEGETMVEAGDHLIVITHHKNVKGVAKLIRPRSLFSKG
ncbi:MAG: Trk system potassium transporter TrkA [Candidatus Zixiibacteriota bacterium]|nr:MAG: Trk system potassium transporter TrkA [candidate division Zixibacteria bacterium]